MGSKLILIVPVPNFQELFTELKKLVPLPRYRASKFQKIAKSYTLGILKFSFHDLGKSLIFGPKSISGPHIGPSCCIPWVFQTLLGNFWDFEIFGYFSGPKSLAFFCDFFDFFAPKWDYNCPKSENLENSQVTFGKPIKCNTWPNMGSWNWFGAKNKGFAQITKRKFQNPQNV